MEQTVNCSKEARSLDLVHGHSEHLTLLTIVKVFQNSTHYVHRPEVATAGFSLTVCSLDHTLHVEQSWLHLPPKKAPDTTQLS